MVGVDDLFPFPPDQDDQTLENRPGGEPGKPRVIETGPLVHLPPVGPEGSSGGPMSAELPAFPEPHARKGEVPGNRPESSRSGEPARIVGEEPLSVAEVQELRRFLSLFGQNWLSRADPLAMAAKDFQSPPPSPAAQAPAPMPATVTVDRTRETLLSLWTQLPRSGPADEDFHREGTSFLNELADLPTFVCVWGAIAGVLALKDPLRHGTPDQKLFALGVLGDRFFRQIAGWSFPQRKPLIKAVGKYFSGLAEQFTFLQAEGEPFSSQYHERDEGSTTSGRTVREMRGFLVIRKDSNQVVRLGRVLT